MRTFVVPIDMRKAKGRLITQSNPLDKSTHYAYNLRGQISNSYAFTVAVMDKIPIPVYNDITAPLYQRLGKLARQIYEIKENDPDADVAGLREEIEKLVRELYLNGAKNAELLSIRSDFAVA